MAALVFDSGGLIALERRDRRVGALLELAARDGVDVITPTACVAQVWRDPARQALLTRALAGFLERPLDSGQARSTGRLLARSGSRDVVDAAVVTSAHDGDVVVTSDANDIERLVVAAGLAVRVLRV